MIRVYFLHIFIFIFIFSRKRWLKIPFNTISLFLSSVRSVLVFDQFQAFSIRRHLAIIDVLKADISASFLFSFLLIFSEWYKAFLTWVTTMWGVCGYSYEVRDPFWLRGFSVLPNLMDQKRRLNIGYKDLFCLFINIPSNRFSCRSISMQNGRLHTHWYHELVWYMC